LSDTPLILKLIYKSKYIWKADLSKAFHLDQKHKSVWRRQAIYCASRTFIDVTCFMGFAGSPLLFSWPFKLTQWAVYLKHPDLFFSVSPLTGKLELDASSIMDDGFAGAKE